MELALLVTQVTIAIVAAVIIGGIAQPHQREPDDLPTPMSDWHEARGAVARARARIPFARRRTTPLRSQDSGSEGPP